MKTITLCMGTYNNEKTLPQVLEALKGQTFDKFLLFDNCSTDNSVKIVAETFPDVVIRTFEHEEKIIDNLCNLRLEMFKYADTDLIFVLDSDVTIPKDSIKEMTEWVSDKIPMAGIQYSQQGHITMGATMLLTIVAKQLKLDNRKLGCDCECIRQELQAMGKLGVYHPTLKAFHLKDKPQSNVHANTIHRMTKHGLVIVPNKSEFNK